MTDLAVACVAWAQQFASSEIAVLVNEDSFDQDYGQYVEIQVVPTALDKPKVEIMIAGQSVGFTVECWERLSNRVVASGASGFDGARSPDRVAAFLEPGATSLQRTAALLDALARGGLEVHARFCRGHLVGSGASIKRDSEVEHLPGPAAGADLLRYVGMVESFKLGYFEWAPKMSSLADRLQVL